MARTDIRTLEIPARGLFLTSKHDKAKEHLYRLLADGWEIVTDPRIGNGGGTVVLSRTLAEARSK